MIILLIARRSDIIKYLKQNYISRMNARFTYECSRDRRCISTLVKRIRLRKTAGSSWLIRQIELQGVVG